MLTVVAEDAVGGDEALRTIPPTAHCDEPVIDRGVLMSHTASA